MLGVYTSLAGAEITTDNSFSNPVKFFSPLGGSVQTQRLFIQSDSVSSENFYNIVVGCVDSLTPDYSGWFQFAPDSSGAPGAFVTGRLSLGTVLYGSSLPFWVQVTIPAQTNPGPMNRFKIYVNYTT